MGMDNHRLAPLSTEFRNAELGDARLKRRLMKIADAVSENPGAGFPEQAGTAGELEGIYRFLESDKVVPESVLSSHVQCTVRRAQQHKEVLVVHDTTEFEFGGEKRREGLGWLNSEHRQGFFGHFSFAVAPSGEPLGTLGLYAWKREGERKGKRSQKVTGYDSDRESSRWLDSALLIAELMEQKAQIIHVTDREGDCYEFFSMLLEHNQRFVVRLCYDRRLSAGRNRATVKLFEALHEAPFYFERQVPIAARGIRKRASKERKKFPARNSRIARLQVRAKCMEIFIGNGAVAHVPDSMRLNFVEVTEPQPPEDEPPVLWRLVTTEPIDTVEQVARVVDTYRMRWLIEEFFKALKTGCRYQSRQLETANALLIDLAIETAVAWRLLLLRWLSRAEPNACASRALSATQLVALRTLIKSKGTILPANPSVQQALYAVAALGGHIKNNGPPGWLVLRRGFEKLYIAEQTLITMTLGPKETLSLADHDSHEASLSTTDTTAGT